MSKLLVAAGVAGLIWLGGKASLTVGNYSLPQINVLQSVTIALALYISSGGYYTLWIVYKTFRRDFRALVGLVKMKLKIGYCRRNNLTVPKLFMHNVANYPNKTALIFEDKKWTYAQLDEYSNRVSHALFSKGLERGEVVALFMENRMEYVGTWLGCAKLGVVAALINFNLRHKALVHSIKVAGSRAVICGAELQEYIHDVEPELEGMKIYVSGLKDNTTASLHQSWLDFDSFLQSADPTPFEHVNEGNFDDNLLYIYTSGTTGMPKAAIIKNSRFLFFSSAVNYLINLTDKDIIYNPLPLYHTAGGLVGMGQVLLFGCTAVIRKKFSVTNYWSEAGKHGCTVAQYVGEICRYLLNTAPKPEDKAHKVRVMYGNGLRSQIWEQFTERFNIPCVTEFYGATESNANIINFEGKPGACGFLSVIASGVYPAWLVRVDESTGEPMRDKNGLCIKCKPGEAGEFVGKIKKNDAVGDFHGYADKKATEKKIVNDVFSKGDCAFLSGDILTMDEFGYVYFKDRLGDTFRWRGENVSTTEVEGIVSVISNHKDAVVYGVEVPFTEGKAGMVAIVDPNQEVDMPTFAATLGLELASYARPLFVRLLNEIDTTGTFKLKKLDLQKEGFDINKIKDKIFVLDSRKNKYLELTEDLYKKLIEGKMGL